MRDSYRIAAVAAVVLGLAARAGGQQKAKSLDIAAMVGALDSALTPGEGQKKRGAHVA